MVDFVSTGGYALKTYDRFRRIVKGLDGLWRVRNDETALRHRMNVGAIVSPAMLSVRIAGRRRGTAGRKIGEVEEGYLEVLEPGDTFMFAGQVWGLVGRHRARRPGHGRAGASRRRCRPGAARSSRSRPSWPAGARLMSDGAHWGVLPDDIREWLEIQRDRSAIPAEDEMLLETFPHGQRHFLVAYPFEGRLAHTTLAMLLTRRLERAGVGPLGFVCNDYALAIWSLKPMDGLDFAELFAEDMLGDDLESWLLESAMMKAAFKACALISGLIERRFRGDQKSGPADQLLHRPGLRRAAPPPARPPAAALRPRRRGAGPGRRGPPRPAAGAHQGPHPPRGLDHLSPFSVPMILEIGKQRSPGAAGEMILAEAAETLIAEAIA